MARRLAVVFLRSPLQCAATSDLGGEALCLGAQAVLTLVVPVVEKAKPRKLAITAQAPVNAAEPEKQLTSV